MARSLTANMVAELQSSSIYPIILIRGFFDSGELNVWTGMGNLTIDGVNYIGTGILLNISDISESQDLSATNFTISMSGLPQEIISFALTENYQERRCSMSLGLLKRAQVGFHIREGGGYSMLESAEDSGLELREDEAIALREDGGSMARDEPGELSDGGRLEMEARDGNLVVVHEPYEFFTGLMDVMTIDEGADAVVVTLSVEHEMIDGDRPIIRKWAPEDHKIDFPDDTGFNYMAGLQQREVVWKG